MNKLISYEADISTPVIDIAKRNSYNGSRKTALYTWFVFLEEWVV
jgi:hypothetical protein